MARAHEDSLSTSSSSDAASGQLTDGPSAASTLSPRRRWLGFWALMLGLFSIISAATSVNTAIPVLQHDLHASLSQVEWLADSYFITVTVFMTTFGRLGDLFGRKRMFLIGAVLFVAGSMGSALARDVNVLIVFRGLTGLGPAMMMPATLSLITILFPPEQRGMPMGLWGSLIGVAIGVGPIMGGLLVDNAGWQWVFWINVILGSASIVLGYFLLPTRRWKEQFTGIDALGIALNAGFVFSLSYALVEGHSFGWTSPLILGLFATSAVLLVLFLVREVSTRYPMLDLNLFRRPAFSAGIAVTLTISFGLLGIFFYMPLFLQGPPHLTPLHAGLALLPLAIAMAIVGPFGGYLATRVPPRWPMAAAMLLFSAGMFWLSHLSVSTRWQDLVPPFLIIGVGLGISSATINTAVMAAVPRSVVGAAAGVVTTVRQLGSVLGIAVLGAILQVRQEHYLQTGTPTRAVVTSTQLRDRAFTHAVDDTFLVCSAVLVCGAVIALLIRHPANSATEVKDTPGDHGLARPAQ